MGQEDPLEEENGNPLQYSCLKSPLDRGAWEATAQKVAKSQIRLKDEARMPSSYFLTSGICHAFISLGSLINQVKPRDADRQCFLLKALIKEVSVYQDKIIKLSMCSKYSKIQTMWFLHGSTEMRLFF